MRVRLIVNPAAGSGRVTAIPDVLEIFSDAGWNVDLVQTSGPGDATRAAAEAVAKHTDLVVASGGDGTVNEALQPLVGASTALGVLPAGTANLLAREMRMPLRAREAAQALIAGERRVVDVGRADGQRYFLLFAGIGFDAAVIHAVDEDLKRRLGPLSFVAASAQVMAGYRGARAEIWLDGRRLRRHLLMAVVANTRLFALFPLTPQANATDGHLDVIIFHGVGWWAKLRHLASVLLLQHQRAPNVERARIRWIEFRSRPPLPIELDGEPWGQTPMRFEVVPNGATIWVPASAPDDLFGRTTGPQAAVSPAID